MVVDSESSRHAEHFGLDLGQRYLFHARVDRGRPESHAAAHAENEDTPGVFVEQHGQMPEVYWHCLSPVELMPRPCRW